jgi:hypothetical protein
MNVMFAPFAPAAQQPRPARSDRQWIKDYRRRTTAARLRPYNRVLAAEAESPHADLAAAWRRAADRGESRAASRARVDAMLTDAAERNALKRWHRERPETLALISRARRGSRAPRRGTAVRALGDGNFDVPACVGCIQAGATAEESFLIHSDPDWRPGVPDPVQRDTGRYQPARNPGREIWRAAGGAR